MKRFIFENIGIISFSWFLLMVIACWFNYRFWNIIGDKRK